MDGQNTAYAERLPQGPISRAMTPKPFLEPVAAKPRLAEVLDRLNGAHDHACRIRSELRERLDAVLGVAPEPPDGHNGHPTPPPNGVLDVVDAQLEGLHAVLRDVQAQVARLRAL